MPGQLHIPFSPKFRGNDFRRSLPRNFRLRIAENHAPKQVTWVLDGHRTPCEHPAIDSMRRIRPFQAAAAQRFLLCAAFECGLPHRDHVFGRDVGLDVVHLCEDEPAARGKMA